MIDLLVISHACFMGINRNIYKLFVQEGWKVEIVVPKTLNFPSGIREAEEPRPDDPPIHYLTLEGGNPRLYLYKELDKVLDDKKPRFVLVDNDPVSRLTLIVAKWCRNNNAKSFCISCENLPLGIMPTIKRRGLRSLPTAVIKRILLSKTKRLVDGVFTLNSDGRRIFLEEGYRRVERMPLGFDPQYFHPDDCVRDELRKRLGLQKKVIAYFGRLTEEKGIHILLKALEKVKDMEWQLMMDEFDHYATEYSGKVSALLRETGIIERVVFVNPSHYEIASYMNASDIIVVPSLSVAHWKEQYGRVAAEAMACGRKVIASDSGSLPELLDGHGWLFPEGDIVALARMLSDALGEKAGTANSTQSIAGYAKKQLSIYRQKEVMSLMFTESTQ